MDKLLPILMDLTVIVFDLLVFTRVMTMKKETAVRKTIMYGGSGLIVAAYFVAVYLFSLPASLSSAACMAIPSLILFLCLSKYRDARFFLTFCFIDSSTLIITFIGRYVGILTGPVGNIAGLAVILLICAGLFMLGKPHFKAYSELLKFVSSGWSPMMVSSILIYFALIFLAAYPKPLVERLEYGPAYLVFSVVVLSSYVVFIDSVVKARKIHQQNLQLQKEKQFHAIAYTDALTGVGNRAAYMERLNTLERTRAPETRICLVLFDLDNFKSINDTMGHQTGDEVLVEAARLLRGIFPEESSGLFRIGGDEFVVIVEETDEETIRRKIRAVQKSLPGRVPYTFSAGYDFLRPGGTDTLEKTFDRADHKMYQEKKTRRESRV